MIYDKNISHQKTTCFHCGDECTTNKKISIGEKYFCCNGCKTVYEILNENDLCEYYELNASPGIEQKNTIRKDKFEFLDNLEIKQKLIQFTDNKTTQVIFYLPQIHCSSCLWLLESINIVDKGIIKATVNFTKKELFITYNEADTSLRKVVETLTKIGYEPHLSLQDIDSKEANKTDRTRWYKIGVAGFCFANIMMVSIADYVSINNPVEYKIKIFFSLLCVVLSLPVLFYAANEFFIAAWNGIKNKYLNIDFPVALALVITFTRSIYELSTGTGNGYLDSMSGIVFFMLIGRWLQSRTYKSISFDRDYKSFFPIALNVINNGKITPTEITQVKKNDIIQVYSNDIIPVDAILSKGNAKIDYSFVSGESLPIHINKGELIYAGGKQLDGLLELIVLKEASQSYLTNLWNNATFTKKQNTKATIYDIIGKYFTYVVLAIGFGSGLFWYMLGEKTLMWNAITTVLIVACPCALLLSQNYTNGNILRIFGLNKFYLRAADVIDDISKINHIVLDKTGTITETKNAAIKYTGNQLSEENKITIASLANQSSHPASKLIVDFLNISNLHHVDNYKETEGAGIEGWINEQHIKIGSKNYVGGEYFSTNNGTKVVVYIDGKILGEFIISNVYRIGISELIQGLKKRFKISLISGDNDSELKNIKNILGDNSEILFNQSPQQKLDYIKYLQNGLLQKVMMIGDGLNDAGALKQSEVGIAVADTKNSFTPSSDGVIDASVLPKLNVFIQLAQAGKNIIFLTFCISAIYNIIGLYFAVQGILSPVIAAILMPCSSISIILLTYGLTEMYARKLHLNK
jgi:Cu+-exporting ATPase